MSGTTGRRRRVVAVTVLGGALAFWGLARALASWKLRTELAQANRAIATGRFADARGRLANLARRWPGHAEVQFQLGYCEAALGQLDAAQASWSRVPADSSFAERAALYRERLALSRGRFAEAESALLGVLGHRGPQAYEVHQRLARLYRFQDRIDDVAQVLEESWDMAPDRVALLREHASLDLEPLPIDAVRGVLAQASVDAPDDDRVWLGRANLARRGGHLAAAAGWLDACRSRRPDDPAVWRGRLRWAQQSEDARAVWEALRHLTERDVPEHELIQIRAWLAARHGDPQTTRKALEAVIAYHPGNSPALEQLAELAIRRGDDRAVAELRSRKAKADRDRRLYRSLVTSDSAAKNTGELARLATALGRRFEARSWWTLVAREDPNHPAARSALASLPPARTAPGATSRTLADLMAGLEPRPAAPAPTPARSKLAAPRFHFEDDARVAGLSFVYDNGRSPLRQIPETMGGGVGLLDYDGDGWLDVYLVQGGPFPPEPDAKGLRDRLFRNIRGRSFEDVTERAGIGLAGDGYGHGVTVGDYDSDGHPDILITRFGRYQLYRNRGDGTFVDVTESAGLGGARDWPTSAAFADLDGDGDLDLYVCHYLEWDPRDPRTCNDPATHAYLYCTPRISQTRADHAFRNDRGRFVDVTAAAGFVDPEGPGLGVVAADFDDDGRIDLFVANDGTANYLFRNRGGFRFEETGTPSGVASSAEGGFQAGMGVACGDLDGDGRPDIAVTNYYGEGTTCYLNLDGQVFADRSASTGILAATRYLLGFGVVIADFNNDGHCDLASVNGHVNDLRPNYPYAMPAQLLAGDGTRFHDVSPQAGAAWTTPRLGRGLALGDCDNDGRVDLILVAQNEPLAYFHNRTEEGHSITFRLEGTTSNRDAVGAKVTVLSNGRRQVGWRLGGGSYQSASDGRLHFGLGSSPSVESAEVRWPSGRIDHFPALAADTGYLLREGASAPMPLKGFAGKPSAGSDSSR